MLPSSVFTSDITFTAGPIVTATLSEVLLRNGVDSASISRFFAVTEALLSM